MPPRAASLAFAIAAATSVLVPSLPGARWLRAAACLVLVFLLFRSRARAKRSIPVFAWLFLGAAIAWVDTRSGAPVNAAFIVSLLVGVFIRRSLAPWVPQQGTRRLALLAGAAVLPIVVASVAGSGAPRDDTAVDRLDRALYTLAVAWIFLAGLRAWSELTRRWIRRARIRTKLVVAFGIFAITPAVLVFCYAALAGWIHSGGVRASAIEGYLEATSGGRGMIERARRDPAPVRGADLAARIEKERPVLEDRGLAALALERRGSVWREAGRFGGYDSLFLPAAAPVSDSAEVVRGLVYRDRKIWWVETAIWGRGLDSLALMTFEPVDSARMEQLARVLRCDAILATSPSVSSGETTITIGAGPPRATRRVSAAGGAIDLSADADMEAELTDSTSLDSLAASEALTIVGGGAFAKARQLRDLRGTQNGAATPHCFLWTESTWRDGAAILLVRTSILEPFSFSKVGTGPFAIVARIVLLFVLALFIVIEIVSLIVGSRVARFITRGAAGLRRAAAALGKGDFSARVQVPSEDELGELADSFNRMAAGLEEGQRAVIEREQLRRELELARRIQSRLLPPGPPELPRLQIAAVNAMSQQVGGDYYDFLPLEDGRLGICIADVSGKGVSAALLMSSVKTALVSSAAVETAPDLMTGRVNRLLEQSIEPGRFVTFFLASLDPATLRLDYVNAGHPAPMLLRAGGAVERLEIGGTILGIDARSAYEAGTTTLVHDDILALFTDGVTEAQGGADDLFGDGRIEAVLRAERLRPATEVLAALIAAVKRYEGERGPSDDLTAIIVKVVT